MTRKDVTPELLLRDFEVAEKLLWSEGLLLEAIPLALRKLSKTESSVETPSRFPLAATVRHRSETIAEHKALLDRKLYTLLFVDGSLAQLSYRFIERRLQQHRLAFYPYPLHDIDDYLEAGFSHVEVFDELSTEEALTRVRRSSPIRFDYDEPNGGPHHFESHLTISSSSCRIPVTQPVGIGHFIRFVMEHFYAAGPQAVSQLQYRSFGRTERMPTPHQIFIDVAPI